MVYLECEIGGTTKRQFFPLGKKRKATEPYIEWVIAHLMFYGESRATEGLLEGWNKVARFFLWRRE